LYILPRQATLFLVWGKKTIAHEHLKTTKQKMHEYKKEKKKKKKKKRGTTWGPR